MWNYVGSSPRGAGGTTEYQTRFQTPGEHRVWSTAPCQRSPAGQGIDYNDVLAAACAPPVSQSVEDRLFRTKGSVGSSCGHQDRSLRRKCATRDAARAGLQALPVRPYTVDDKEHRRRRDISSPASTSSSMASSSRRSMRSLPPHSSLAASPHYVADGSRTCFFQERPQPRAAGIQTEMGLHNGNRPLDFSRNGKFTEQAWFGTGRQSHAPDLRQITQNSPTRTVRVF
eukprot:TRINITY_DN15438_c0_g1_i1.p1 TRINITY_DN15438_c0_g1~~TRINITY_DN15438_c0_g1_i1.p1  ORF type:complete len:228 (-),score=20.84 TRINITY_DN15438_c0_g1_i1:165-848(-)